MASENPGMGSLIAALLFGLAAAGAMAFVLIEPIRAYDSLSAYEALDLPSAMSSRMREAALPTAAGMVAGLLSVGLALWGRRGSRALFLVALLVGGVSLLAGVFVYVFYPLQF